MKDNSMIMNCCFEEIQEETLMIISQHLLGGTDKNMKNSRESSLQSELFITDCITCDAFFAREPNLEQTE
jgi:hypothetical protein